METKANTAPIEDRDDAPIGSEQDNNTTPLAQMSVLELSQYLQTLATTPGEKKVKLSDFAGVGKEMWQQIDVDEYIRQERDSWECDLPMRPNVDDEAN